MGAAGSQHYSMDERERAVAAYVVGGTFAKAETICGIPQDTISKWRLRDNAWWVGVEERIRQEHEQEHRAAIRDIIIIGLNELRDRVQHGDFVQDEDGNYTKRKPMIGRDLVIATGTMVDKLRVSLGQATSIAGKADTSANKLEDLRKAATSAAKEQAKEDGLLVDISGAGRAEADDVRAKISGPAVIAA